MAGRLPASWIALVCATLLICGPASTFAQQPGEPTVANLVGTWTLVSIERPGAGPGPTTIANPRGVLIFDSAGHALEIVTRAGRRPYASPQPTPAEAQTTFGDYGGFWGTYHVDEPRGRIAYRLAGAVNPNLMGEELVRSLILENDRLAMTALPGTRDTQPGTRWVWERVPVIENLSPANRGLVGFWQHVVERRVNATTGALVSETRRAPSVIVYTPAGYVGVHFPPLDRKRFAADLPTDDEALTAIRGYVGYYGVYLMYPGIVSHHQLATLGPGQGTSFKRFYELSGTEISLKFPPAMFQGQQVRTIVTLRRLSGEAEMLGK